MNYEQWLKHVETRLHLWAQWCAQDNHYGLGYPSCSLEYRIMREGTLVRTTQPPQITSNLEAEEMEALISELSQYHTNMAQALRCHYFLPGGLREKSKHLKVSHSHYKHCVDLAHQWLVGRLSARAEKTNNKNKKCLPGKNKSAMIFVD